MEVFYVEYIKAKVLEAAASRAGDRAYPGGAPTGAEGSGFTQAAFGRLLGSAGERLDIVRQRSIERAAAKAAEKAAGGGANAP
jgi:hypothetical protein